MASLSTIKQALSPLASPFFSSLTTSLCLPLIFPKVTFLFFAPFLILLLQKKGLKRAFVASTLIAFLHSFLSSVPFMVLFSSYFFALFVCYRFNALLLENRLLFMSLATFLFSFIWNGVDTLLFSIFSSHSIPFFHLLGHVTLSPFLDALFAFCFFTLPHLLFKGIKISSLVTLDFKKLTFKRPIDFKDSL